MRNATRFKGTAQSWSGHLVKALIRMIRGMWDHRNDILFDPKHTWLSSRRNAWDQRIQERFSSLVDSEWDWEDRRFFTPGVDRVLVWSDEAKQQWLASVDKAKARTEHKKNRHRMQQTTLEGWIKR